MSILNVRPVRVIAVRPKLSTTPKPAAPKPTPTPKPGPKKPDRWDSWDSWDNAAFEGLLDTPMSLGHEAVPIKAIDRDELTAFEITRLDLTGFAGPLASPDCDEPSPRSEAWLSGFNRGYERDRHAGPSAELAGDLSLSWWVGHSAGSFVRDEADDRIIDRRQFEHSEAPIFASSSNNVLTDEDVHPAGCVS